MPWPSQRQVLFHWQSAARRAVNVTHRPRRPRNAAPRSYRGHRIVAVQLDGTWHAVVQGYAGAIAPTNITSTSLADAMAQAEWFIETRLAFRPPPPRYERMAG